MEKPAVFFNYAMQQAIIFGEIGVKILLIIAAGSAILLLIRYTLNKLTQKDILPLYMADMLGTILRWIVVLLMILLVLQSLGIPLNNFWALLSTMVTLIALGFVAVWSVLSNVFCAFLLFIFHPFRIGDEVELFNDNTQSVSDKVTRISLMFISLKESSSQANKPHILQIPNNMFFQKMTRVWKR